MAHRYKGADIHEFAKALNLVVVVFNKNDEVKQSLHKYLEYTSNGNFYTDSQRVDVFFDLITKISKDMNYTINHTEISNFYSPKLENEG